MILCLCLYLCLQYMCHVSVYKKKYGLRTKCHTWMSLHRCFPFRFLQTQNFENCASANGKKVKVPPFPPFVINSVPSKIGESSEKVQLRSPSEFGLSCCWAGAPCRNLCSKENLGSWGLAAWKEGRWSANVVPFPPHKRKTKKESLVRFIKITSPFEKKYLIFTF